MAIEIVDFPINSMVDLSIAMLVHQRVKQRNVQDFAASKMIHSNPGENPTANPKNVMQNVIQATPNME